MSEDFLQIRYLLREDHIGYVKDDTPVAIRIRQVGGAEVTSVTVTTGNDIELIDSDGTTTVEFATYTTIGEVADAINATSNWECKVLDALRSDASANTLVDGAISSSVTDGVTYYDALVDTDAKDSVTYRVTYDRAVGENRPKGAHRVHLKEFTYNVDVNAAQVDGVQVWECDGSEETQKVSRNSVDSTETTVNWANGRVGLTAAEGNDLVVRIDDTTSISDSNDNFLEVVGVLE